ncbi:uncharacterized protein EKO05_0005430 [Ascochyta rabiei]|uniref:uncharacterized protein n=1 Tax=Didymella rabiei TaxID=5454 RepID=UPI002202A7AB|nr:uncharacterized protein EKO05_0005430 [Ascochyta rabiei]UPX14962.1 hypothetical protein EKO05_0005430 [Ascochyta rabiei]
MMVKASTNTSTEWPRKGLFVITAAVVQSVEEARLGIGYRSSEWGVARVLDSMNISARTFPHRCLCWPPCRHGRWPGLAMLAWRRCAISYIVVAGSLGGAPNYAAPRCTTHCTAAPHRTSPSPRPKRSSTPVKLALQSLSALAALCCCCCCCCCRCCRTVNARAVCAPPPTASAALLRRCVPAPAPQRFAALLTAHHHSHSHNDDDDDDDDDDHPHLHHRGHHDALGASDTAPTSARRGRNTPGRSRFAADRGAVAAPA